MELRSIPEVYAGFYSQKKPLELKEHYRWWFSRNQDWRKFIIEIDGIRVGILNIGQLDHWSPEIGYAVHPLYWGKGIGTQAVRLALEYLRKHNKEYCHTTVLKSNERSINLLKRLGFTYLGEARDDEIWMQKRLI